MRVVAAEGLVAADRGGTSDPFVALSFQDGAPLKKTAVVRKTLDPTWNEVGLTRARARARALSLSLSLSLALSLSLSHTHTLHTSSDTMRRNSIQHSIIRLPVSLEHLRPSGSASLMVLVCGHEHTDVNARGAVSVSSTGA